MMMADEKSNNNYYAAGKLPPVRRHRLAKSADVGKDDEAQQLLASLIEGQRLNTAIKTIFDRGWQSSFEDFLDSHIQKRDSEIKTLCNTHYSEFIGAIDSLVTVKLEIQELRLMMNDLNQKVQDSGQAYVELADELLAARETHRNISQALELAQDCLAVVDMMAKARDQITQAKYFAALRTLEELQDVYLVPFTDYEFGQHLNNQVPLMVHHIKDQINSGFSSWLSQAKRVSGDLGSAALQGTERLFASNSVGGVVGAGAGAAPVSVAAADDRKQPEMPLLPAMGEDLFDQIQLDFSPLYQCMHVYEHLGQLDKFQVTYHDERMSQLQYMLDALDSEPDGNIAPDEHAYNNGNDDDVVANSHAGASSFAERCLAYFGRLAGFFIVEENVLKSGNDLIPHAQVQQMWDMALKRIRAVLSARLERLTDPSQWLDVKRAAVLFTRTMHGYGFSGAELTDFLNQQRVAFEDVLVAQLQSKITSILDEEKFDPWLVADERTYNRSVLGFRLEDQALHVQFPTTMAFSSSVPQLCKAVKRLVVLYHAFISMLGSSDGALIAQLVDKALSMVNGGLNSLIDHSQQLHISQAIQCSINASYLANACDYFDSLVVDYGDSSDNRAVKLKARGDLFQTRIRCEDLIFELIDAKIDDFLSLAANLDWAPSEVRTYASEFIQDLVVYLETTFITMMFMPDAVRKAVHFTSFRHVSEVLMDQLVTVKKFNILSIANLNVDLEELESFAHRCPIPALVETFSELRQLVDLLLSGNPEQFLQQHVRESQYPRLAPSKLVKILDGYKDVGMFAKVPANVPKLKKKQVDAFVKKLRHMD